MQQIEERIYNEEGELLQLIVHEIEVPTQEKLIAEKEALLIQIYEELKALKGEN